VKDGTVLLVDGDNVPPEILGPMLKRLGADGPVPERRIFRNWRSSRNATAWDNASKAHAFDRVDRYRTSAGKNASDIALVVTAMDLLHAGYRRFCIASGDTDFAPLVERLRRAGSHVVLIGHKDKGGILTEVADEYLEFRALEKSKSPPKAPAKPAARAPAKPAPKTTRKTQSKQAPKQTKAVGGKAPPAGKATQPPKSRSATPQAKAQAAPAKQQAKPPQGKPTPPQGTPAPNLEGLRLVLLDCYEVARTDGELDRDGWIAVDRLGQIARSVDPSFSLAKYGAGQRAGLSKVIQRLSPTFEVQAIGRSGNVQYRVRRPD
jgi:hypothetical protein